MANVARAVQTHEVSARRRRFRSLRSREHLVAYLFLAPQLLGLLFFVAGPLIASGYLSFTKWNLLDPEPTWTGLENWRYLVRDERVVETLGNTVRFIMASTTSFLLLSLLLALLLNTPRRGISILRAMFFLPWVISQVAVGVAWSWMFNVRSGPVARALDTFGVDRPNLLLSESGAMIAVGIVATWQALGYGMTVYLAGLQGVPSTLYDAAKVDGANPLQRFRDVTLPLLSPTILFLTITSMIGAFQLFDLVITLTGGSSGNQPGGPGGSTTTIVLYLYNQMFVFSGRIAGLGYASTLSWMLAGIILLVTLVQWLLARKWVFYVSEHG